MMSPKVPKAYLEARRKEIIDAACQCFTEKGFHNTSMQDIYNATNLSPGAVYNYFTSKEDIVAGCAQISQQRNSEMIEAAVLENKDEALSNLGSTLLSFAKQIELPKAISFDFALYSESLRNPRIAEALRKNINASLRKIVELVKYNQDKGVLNKKLDPVSISQVLVNIFIGLGLQKLLLPETNIDSYMAVYEAMVRGTFSQKSGGGGDKKDASPSERTSQGI